MGGPLRGPPHKVDMPSKQNQSPGGSKRRRKRTRKQIGRQAVTEGAKKRLRKEGKGREKEGKKEKEGREQKNNQEKKRKGKGNK